MYVCMIFIKWKQLKCGLRLGKEKLWHYRVTVNKLRKQLLYGSSKISFFNHNRCSFTFKWIFNECALGQFHHTKPSFIIFFFFHHTTCESTCDTLASSAANQGDNTVSVAQGGTATPGATELLLPPDRVFKRNIYLCISFTRCMMKKKIYT